ncbi:MAG: hypothetical protein BJ554DRAFT_6096, partial [Olpidium bornovanus]
YNTLERGSSNGLIWSFSSAIAHQGSPPRLLNAAAAWPWRDTYHAWRGFLLDLDGNARRGIAYIPAGEMGAHTTKRSHQPPLSRAINFACIACGNSANRQRCMIPLSCVHAATAPCRPAFRWSVRIRCACPGNSRAVAAGGAVPPRGALCDLCDPQTRRPISPSPRAVPFLPDRNPEFHLPPAFAISSKSRMRNPIVRAELTGMCVEDIADPDPSSSTPPATAPPYDLRGGEFPALGPREAGIVALRSVESAFWRGLSAGGRAAAGAAEEPKSAIFLLATDPTR